MRRRAKAGVVALLVATASNAAGVAAQGLGSWSGPYIGTTGGGAFADVKGATRAGDLAWSAHAGYGVAISALYLGVEADATWGGARTASYVSPLILATAEIDWSATARARIGLAMPGILIYATGGFAWSERTVAVNALGAGLSTATHTTPGAVIGAGIEMRVLPQIALRLEALRYDFSAESRSLAGVGALVPPATSLKGLDLDQTVVRAGVSLRF